MIVIIEGIDRVGKTTLANKLRDECGFKIYKHMYNMMPYDKMNNDDETDKVIQLLTLAKLSNTDIIFDRSAWSDFVYGIINRNYNKPNALRNLKMFEQVFNDVDGILIYVGPTNLSKSSKEHGSSLQWHLDLFNEIFDVTILKNIQVCDYNNMDSVINYIKLIKEVKNDNSANGR